MLKSDHCDLNLDMDPNGEDPGGPEDKSDKSQHDQSEGSEKKKPKKKKGGKKKKEPKEESEDSQKDKLGKEDEADSRRKTLIVHIVVLAILHLVIGLILWFTAPSLLGIPTEKL